MRKVSLLMVLAIAAFMSLGGTGALAAGKKPAKPDPCKHGKSDGKCNPKPKKPRPKPKKCDDGSMPIAGKCTPKPPECPYGKGDDGCNPKPPVVVPPPKGGPCSKADLVLLEDLLKGTGALLCLYVGDNAPNATQDYDCPDALLALPLDHLLGACLYLPPADVERSTPTPTTTSAPSASNVSAVTDAAGAGGATGLQDLVSSLTGLLKLG
jgi:hypothetical protein